MALKFTNAIDTLKIAEYDGRKISLCTTEDGIMKFQIPRMYMPFGISGFTPEVGPTKYNIDFAMKGYDEEGNYVKKFYEILREIENKVIESVSQQSEKIFGKKIYIELTYNYKNSDDKLLLIQNNKKKIYLFKKTRADDFKYEAKYIYDFLTKNKTVNILDAKFAIKTIEQINKLF